LLACIERDLKSIYALEIENNDQFSVMSSGHGIPVHLDHFVSNISFWSHPINNNMEFSIANSEKAILGVESGIGNILVLPKHISQYITSLETEPNIGIINVPILGGTVKMLQQNTTRPFVFVIKLDNPIVISQTIFDRFNSFQVKPSDQQFLVFQTQSYEKFIVNI
jgi:hypothetical protein